MAGLSRHGHVAVELAADPSPNVPPYDPATTYTWPVAITVGAPTESRVRLNHLGSVSFVYAYPDRPPAGADQSCNQARSSCHDVCPGDWVAGAHPVAGISVKFGVAVITADVTWHS